MARYGTGVPQMGFVMPGGKGTYKAYVATVAVTGTATATVQFANINDAFATVQNSTTTVIGSGVETASCSSVSATSVALVVVQHLTGFAGSSGNLNDTVARNVGIFVIGN